MNRRLCAIIVIAILHLNFFNTTAKADEMTFQLINDTEFTMNFKLFSRGETHRQWPSKTRAYAINPGTTPQQVKIDCDQGEKVCWGAWSKVQNVSGQIVGPNGERTNSRRTTYSAGAGERGQRTCEMCCHVCKDGALLPAVILRDRGSVGK